MRHAAYDSDDAKWHAMNQNDAQADGAFLVGVLTTKIYCRPTCTARLPLRKNVRFFNDWQSAAAAGLRACKRCKPNGTGPLVTQALRIVTACRAIEHGIKESNVPSLEVLASTANLSPWHFQKQFKTHLGISPKQYTAALRDKVFKETLISHGSITDALYEAGYSSSSRVYETAPARLGMNAKNWKKGAAMQNIRYQITQSWLGTTLIAATDKGICAVFMDEDKQALRGDLQNRFPNAVLEEAEQGSDFEKWVTHALNSLESPSAAAHIPLDIQGTAFQEQVWRALQKIPAGQTWTYKDLAIEIGNVKAVRAVASACGANPVSVLIPCHRVIGSNGKMTGYRWGIERKRKLLNKEASGTLL